MWNDSMEPQDDTRRPTVFSGRLVVLFFVALLPVCAEHAIAGDFLLTESGKTDYSIVLPEKPTPVERTAARELRKYLNKVTGAALPIVRESEMTAEQKKIVVGDGAITKQLLPEFNAEKLGPDSIRIKTVGDDLVLVGHSRRGTLYAVFTFLEDILGVNWWTFDEEDVPHRPTLTITALDIAYTPKLADRATRYLQLSDGCFVKGHPLVTPEEQRKMGIFAARLKLNGHDNYCLTDEYGGRDKLVGWVHTFYEINGLLPPGKYFKAHPEWYSLIKGKRTHRHAQLCLTNKEMQAEMVRVVLRRLRNNPDATMISVSQNDNTTGYCRCEKCRALNEKEGSPSGSLIHFVNAIAEEVEKEYPDVLIETLAYRYSETPPKHVKPRHNVIIRLCPIGSCYSETFREGKRNAEFRKNIEAWGKVAKQLYIWDYIANFHGYFLPHPNDHVLADNLRYVIEHGAIGVFEQGDSGCRVGDFVHYRAWLMAHLLWNPDADEKQLAQKFMNGYYGSAGPYLLKYRELLCDAVKRADINLRCYRTTTADWLTLETLNEGTRLFAKASAAVADDPVLSRRVRRERLTLDHVWLRRYETLKAEAERTRKPFLGPKDPNAALDELLALVKDNRIGEIRQHRRFPDDYGEQFSFRLKKRIPAGEVPEVCKDYESRTIGSIFRRRTTFLGRKRGCLQLWKTSTASNRFSRRMPNTHTIWACHSLPLGRFGVKEGEHWTVYAKVRCDAKSKEGTAMRLGIYDDKGARAVVTRPIPVRTICGQDYQLVKLGTCVLGEKMYLWAAPVVRDPEEVEAVYVDRFFLVREKQ